MEHIDQLLAMVRHGGDLERVRGWAKPQNMEALLAAYWTLPTLEEKNRLIYLFTDRIAPGGRAVMLDFLKLLAEPTALETLGEDMYTWGKVNAVCQLEGHLDNSEKYWDDRKLLDEVARRYLSEQMP